LGIANGRHRQLEEGVAKITTSRTISLPRDAQGELDRYLIRVKTALHAYPSVDADEVERDIRGHIEAELSESTEPVTLLRLRAVLERLGRPSQWVPAEELPLWRKLLIRMRVGPDDWRLAYLTFALFVAAVVFIPIAPALLLASCLTARATLALLEEEGEPIGARSWLVYPPLVLLYIAIALAIVLLPPAPVLIAADPTLRDAAAARLPAPFWPALACALALAAGIWWALLGAVLARFTAGARVLFRPFGDWLDRRHGLRLALLGGAIGVIGAGGLAALILIGGAPLQP
jgi:hypothetical protein